MEKLPWFRLTLGALVIWILFGLVPIALGIFGVFSDEATTRFSHFGGMFGAASAFFSGFALIGILLSTRAQMEALRLQKHELSRMQENQRQALTLQIVMPFMDDIASEEFRQASNILAEYERAGTLGRYRDLRHNPDRTHEEQEEFERLDSARRRFVHVFHKMARLARNDAVDSETVKTVFSPDLVWTLLYVDEPMEEAIRANYSHRTFEYFQSLYDPEEIIGQWPRTPGNPLATRLKDSAFA
ncbi:hypothetical protein [Henriciella sp.]|uniref:hypothetical protein n=1 Tax=Henriciella sp. TaxID=1968823 RepID=UPI00260C29E4|nr:hypothetical protein [Henriciella sp.]